MKVRTFLFQIKLMVGNDKTILMFLGSTYWLNKLDISTIQLGDIELKAVDDTKNLGIIFFDK